MKRGTPSAKKSALIGKPLPNIPWEPRPENSKAVVWRHSGNPIIDLHPFENARSAYNSCVVPWGEEFIGVFRVDWLCMTPYLHLGRASV